MNILSLIAVLVGSNWSTTCVMTQENLEQGYTIDSVAFQHPSTPTKNTLNVTMNRTWFKDSECKIAADKITAVTGTVLLGEQVSAFSSNVEADWSLNNNSTTQLGALAYDQKSSSIQLGTSSFGKERNTMLSLFIYFASQK